MPVRISRRPLGPGRTLTLTGIATARDLKIGLLSLMRDNGWSEPVLWDFREATGLDVSPTDLTDIVSFIQSYTVHRRPCGRVALLATLPEIRETAGAYRSLHSPSDRRKMRVVDTLPEADGWLDAQDAGASMGPRAMRVSLSKAIATLDGQASEIVNVSRTGALLITPNRANSADEHHLSIRVGQTVVDLDVRVVRAEPDSTAAVRPYWRVAVMFLAPEAALERLRGLLGSR